jgi:hypothetical protein
LTLGNFRHPQAIPVVPAKLAGLIEESTRLRIRPGGMQPVISEPLDTERAHDVSSCQECHPADGNDRPYVVPLSYTEAMALFRALGYWRGGKLSCIRRIRTKFGEKGRIDNLAAEAEMARRLLDRIEHQTGTFPRRDKSYH